MTKYVTPREMRAIKGFWWNLSKAEAISFEFRDSCELRSFSYPSLFHKSNLVLRKIKTPVSYDCIIEGTWAYIAIDGVALKCLGALRDSFLTTRMWRALFTWEE